jgi:hypothetical protein
VPGLTIADTGTVAALGAVAAAVGAAVGSYLTGRRQTAVAERSNDVANQATRVAADAVAEAAESRRSAEEQSYLSRTAARYLVARVEIQDADPEVVARGLRELRGLKLDPRAGEYCALSGRIIREETLRTAALSGSSGRRRAAVFVKRHDEVEDE